MSNTGDVPSLEPLEERAAPQAQPLGQAVTLVAQTSGVGAPAFSPRAHKEYYRFFFAGLIMFLGCLMPFGPEWDMAGYKTISGALFMLIALGIMWSGWVAIGHNKFGGFTLRWIALAFLPFGVELYNLILFANEPAIASAVAAKAPPMPANWGELWECIKGFKNPELSVKLNNWVRYFGTGKLVVFAGALYAEFHLMMAIFGGVKAGKQKKAQGQAARAGRKSR
jgi:hypothetical protein